MTEELTERFVELVKSTLIEGVSQAINDGHIEIYIGFKEVEVEDASSYTISLIRPFVHIKSII